MKDRHEKLTEILSDLAGRYAYVRGLVQLMQAMEHSGKQLEKVMSNDTLTAWKDFHAGLVDDALNAIGDHLERQNESIKVKMN